MLKTRKDSSLNNSNNKQCKLSNKWVDDGVEHVNRATMAFRTKPRGSGQGCRTRVLYATKRMQYSTFPLALERYLGEGRT